MSGIDDYYASFYVPWDDGGLAAKVIITPASAGDPFTATVVDKREGVEMDIGEGTLHAAKPAVIVRVTELTANGVTPGDLVKGSIETDDGSFKHEISAWAPKPGPALHPGEAYLILGRKL